MSKLYIHIGTHKTGSTAIQSSLNENQYFLQKEGIIYITNPLGITTLERSQKTNEEVICHARDSLQHEISKSCKKNNNIQSFIISHEGLSGDPLLGYKNARLIAESLKAITYNLFDDVYIIVYLRRQDDFIESLYTQMIHEGEAYTFENFIQNFDSNSFNWELLLRSYSEFFGKTNLIVKRYDKEYLPKADSIIQEFGQIISSKYLENYVVSRTHNSGYSRRALEIAKLTNPYLNQTERNQLRGILQTTNARQPFDTYSFFSQLERESFLSKYSESNSFVAIEYFNESSGMLFPPLKESKNHTQYVSLSAEDVAIVVAKCLIQYTRQDNSYILRWIVLFEKRLIGYLGKYPIFKRKLKEWFNKYK